MRHNTSAPGGLCTLRKVSELSGINPLTLRIQEHCDGLINPARTSKEVYPEQAHPAASETTDR
jgi:hypothetical protein